MLKQRVFSLFVVLFFVTISAQATQTQRRGDQGYGAMLGNPSGVSAKYWLSDTTAIDGAFGVARGEVDVHATFLFHKLDWWGTRLGRLESISANGDFPLYFGVGPRLLFEQKEEFGIRFPVGVSFLKFNSPWEFFGEVAPVLRLTPSAGLNGDYAIGVRYYFKSIRPMIKKEQ